MTSPTSGPSSLTIYFDLLDVADEVLKAASTLEQPGTPEDLARSRVRCASALLLTCSALEACINVFAGLFYSNPGISQASTDGWLPSTKYPGCMTWHEKRPVDKWQNFAHKFADHCLTGSGISGWGQRLESLFDARNELITHFKGAWGAHDLEQRFQALTAASVGADVQFARVLVNALDGAYQAKHGKLAYSTTPPTGIRASTPQPWIELPGGPIGTAGKDRVGPA